MTDRPTKERRESVNCSSTVLHSWTATRLVEGHRYVQFDGPAGSIASRRTEPGM